MLTSFVPFIQFLMIATKNAMTAPNLATIANKKAMTATNLKSIQLI